MMQVVIEKISTGDQMGTYLRPAQVAAILQVSTATLANWRYQGIGPRYTKLSESPNSPVRYRQDDVEAYLDKQMVQTGGDAA